MHLARTAFGILCLLAALGPAFPARALAAADRTPLIGSGPTPPTAPASINPGAGAILVVDPATVPCLQKSTFDDIAGGTNPGTNYDGLVVSGGVTFAERFAGQVLGASGDFDLVTGAPSNPLALQAGAAGQNLDVFDYSSNVLAGLGPIGFPDIDAIGEGAIAMLFAVPQSEVAFRIVGGNGGSATLTFYSADGSLIDTIVLSGLGDSGFGFVTSNGLPSISGILVQNTDPSGLGIDDVCHDPGVTKSRSVSWGNLKSFYR